LLPPSAFDILARLQVDYPMLFKLQVGGGGSSPSGDNNNNNRSTHCGVLEFTAEEGCVYIPFWMMQNLLIEEGTLLTVRNVSLPKATFVKLQPQSVDFLEISNPRAVLEHALRNYSCVTLHDVIQIPYNGKNYHFELKEVKPSPAACIIETDCNVDFDAPVGYQEPEKVFPNGAAAAAASATGVGSQHPSACPSPVSTTSSMPGVEEQAGQEASAKKPPGIRIVDGRIIRPEDNDAAMTSSQHSNVSSDLIAERTGSTGVQKNAAVFPVAAPTIDYWAVHAGDGARRLDGKPPAPLKDTAGNEVDIRRLRAEAAAKRAEAAAKEAAASLAANAMNGSSSSGGGNMAAAGGANSLQNGSLSGGLTLSGKAAIPANAEGMSGTAQPTVPVAKRRTLIGSKYSRLKKSAGAFDGSGSSLSKGGM
jgi:ubiquitin fusion degradation protein 1